MKVPTPKASIATVANLFLLGAPFFKAAAACFPNCPLFQDGWGDFGLDTNPPEPGYLYEYVIFAFPNGACDYINSEDLPLNPPYGFGAALLNKDQPNCLPEWDNELTFHDKFNDTSSIIGSCDGFTCVFPKGICTWNQRGEVIYADPNALCPTLLGCDTTFNC
ncbi:hypothetical protein D9757_001112 [Collybiopsis confluens]|uniref:Uncharacterized protein n=1 Tax=Collybiopsis confluens TaxID=2823264 RepID=A0A8H5I0T4_9AGAR|nr:hypothetical protein D9757_001112 [Collybiopsis confluens]